MTDPVHDVDDTAQPLGTTMASLDPVDAALAAALGVRDPAAGPDELVTRDELAELVDVPVAVLEAIEREGLLVPRAGEVGRDDARFATGDAPTVQAAMRMLATGLPLAEFLDLARRADRQLRDLADEAVELFLLFVRDPVRGSHGDSPEAAQELVTAFHQMLPATRDLVGGHFRALVLAAARARMAEAIAMAESGVDGIEEPDRPDAAP